MAQLLVVDDEPFNLEIIAEFLSGRGHELAFAQDGGEAWQMLEAAPERFSAVILDRMMPRMDGMEVLRRLKADARFDAVPVIMQTAATDPEEVAEGLAAGARYYLAKPLRIGPLNRIVDAALAERHSRQELTRLSTGMKELLGMTRHASYRFRTLGQARLLAATLARLCPNEGAVAMGLSELVFNAVEHGNLGISYAEKGQLLEAGTWQEEIEKRLASPELAGRWAELEIIQETESISFTIRDQGDGFAWEGYLDMAPDRAFHSHGRGIALARQIAFSSLEYRGRGNVVTATVKLPGDAT